MELLTITDPMLAGVAGEESGAGPATRPGTAVLPGQSGPARPRRVVLVLARQHPGESAASLIVQVSLMKTTFHLSFMKVSDFRVYWISWCQDIV